LKDLAQRLLLLTAQQQAAFGALCCDRHLPQYVEFSKEQLWGDPSPFRRALDLAWLKAVDEEIEGGILETLLDQCVEATPDSDDFPAVESVSCAQDAAIMVCHLVKFLETGGSQSIVDVSSRARDLTDAKVQIVRRFDAFDPEIEARIASDPLMVAEIHKQTIDLESVERSTRPQDLVRLRRFSSRLP
jgi:uncharacterized protein YjaG (DUF416 family)